ncbi:MAG: dihydroneopterin aldolase, partial [Bacteroidia bacterium]|nr:dihydroneopterin aldolase [Bacteroidia bacterium]
MEVYAYHGCLKEESVVGNRFRVDVKIEGDFMKSASTDKLEDTIDYCLVYNTV